MKRFKNIFQKVVACMFMAIAFSGTLAAQDFEEEEALVDARAEQTFRLIYIAQGNEEEMPSESLVDRMNNAWNAGIKEGGPMIFYLARGHEEPVIVKLGCAENIDYDDERKVLDEEVIGNIRSSIRYGAGQDDKKRLLQLLYNKDEKENGLSIFDATGQPLYKETKFEFHVGQDFWDEGYNEKIIASLYFELNMQHHIDTKKFSVNVFCPRKMNFDNEKPYGLLNPDDCNKNLRPNTYY